MRKIVLNLAVSLDGYISRQDGKVDWLDDLDTDGDDLGFVDFLNTCDALIMGRNSYEVTLALGNGTWPFSSHMTYVFTSKKLEDQKQVKFVHTDVEEYLRGLVNQEGKNIWLFGGGSFIKSLRALNLVDEYIITTIPKFIGEGIKLFEIVDNEVDLELKQSKVVNSIMTNHYIVKK